MSAEALTALAASLYDRGWLPATSGNLSVRIDADHALITASGRHKGRLTEEDFLVVDLDGRPVGPGRPSAETLLHCRVYRDHPDTGAVLHVHSPAATVLSRACPDGVRVQGWEVAKALPGVTTHEAALLLPVVANDQDVARLAEAAARATAASPLCSYAIAGHGLYAWGATLDDALRHLEGVEALCQLEILHRSLR
jgi:methylthioribulose-1-phosphate dehydratase